MIDRKVTFMIALAMLLERSQKTRSQFDGDNLNKRRKEQGQKGTYFCQCRPLKYKGKKGGKNTLKYE